MSYHCGYVGLIGLPNAGKSSLLNNLLGEELSIVSAKPQTTRKMFTGIYTDATSQLIFLDAPGFVPGKSGMFDFLRAEFFRVLDDVDHLLLVLANDQTESSQFMAMWNAAKGTGKSRHLVITKIDQTRSDFCQDFLVNEWGEQPHFAVNNLSRDKKPFAELIRQLAVGMPTQSGYFFAEDQLSPWQLRDLAAEWVREACFQNLEMEVPFGVAIRVNSFDESPQLIRIDVTIMVDRESHKAIVIGRGGSMLRMIGQQAREKMEKILGQKVFLQTHVSTKKNWQKDDQFMLELGYNSGKS